MSSTPPAPPHINPPLQVVVHYVAMTPTGRVFDSSLDKGKPYDIRVGAGQVGNGLPQGLGLGGGGKAVGGVFLRVASRHRPWGPFLPSHAQVRPFPEAACTLWRMLPHLALPHLAHHHACWHAQVIPGLDEGIKTMKTGGIRRLYIPGTLAFPKGLKAAAGRCAAMGCCLLLGVHAARLDPGQELGGMRCAASGAAGWNFSVAGMPFPTLCLVGECADMAW